MRVILLSLSFMLVAAIGSAQQPTNPTKAQPQAKSATTAIPTAVDTPVVVPAKVTTTTTPATATTPATTSSTVETIAAPVPPPAPQQPAPQPVPPAEPVLDPTKSILIMINESAPDQVAVFDSTGKWLDTVKIMSMNIDVGTGAIVATLTSWKGVMKPKTPKLTKFKVKEVKSVTAEIFADKLEELNK